MDIGHTGGQREMYGEPPPFSTPGCGDAWVEEGEGLEDRDGGTYVQEIFHGGVEHHQVCEEGAEIRNGALHHALGDSKGQLRSEKS